MVRLFARRVLPLLLRLIVEATRIIAIRGFAVQHVVGILLICLICFYIAAAIITDLLFADELLDVALDLQPAVAPLLLLLSAGLLLSLDFR